MDDVVQKSVPHNEFVGGDNVVTLPCIGGDTHVIYPDGGGNGVSLPNDGTIPKHVDGVSYIDQDRDPWYNGPKFY